MENYHVLHMVGQGCFGTVFKGRRKFTGRIVALKFISKRGKPNKDLQNLRLEIGILQCLDHPNIIRMLDAFETGTDFVVVTEFAHGELYEIFQDDRSLPEDEVRRVSRQLVLALHYLHSQKIVHRDMKPQNVLVGANGVVKLCDFGFARAMSYQTTVLTSIKGTPLYMSPELVSQKPYDFTADLWSLGVICYELFVGQPPFYTNSWITLISIIVEKAVTYPENMSDEFKTFLQGLLQKNPRQRLAWPHLLQHPFVKDSSVLALPKLPCSFGDSGPLQEQAVGAGGLGRAGTVPARTSPLVPPHPEAFTRAGAAASPPTAASRPPPSRWCQPVVAMALADTAASAADATAMLMSHPWLLAHVLELAVAMCTAMLQHYEARGAPARHEWHEVLSPLDAAAEAALAAALRSGAGRQGLQDLSLTEAVELGAAPQEPLDGPLRLAAIAAPPLAARLVVDLASTEDPQVVLGELGPRGMLRLFDLLILYREAVPATRHGLRLCLLLLRVLHMLAAWPPLECGCLPHIAVAFSSAVDLVVWLSGVLGQGTAASAADLVSDFQGFHTVATVLSFLAVAPGGAAEGTAAAASPPFSGVGGPWWLAMASGMKFFGQLTTQHPILAHEFAQKGGLRLLAEHRLLRVELLKAPGPSPSMPGRRDGPQLVSDALLVISQLSRLSKEYYPALASMDLMPDLRALLTCDDPGVQAKACNVVGNFARHSGDFYEAIRRVELLRVLVPLCSDADAACRKFASFAVGNLAFHSEVLYPGLAPAVSRLARLLADDDEKTRANAAGAIGNLVRNSADLCPMMLEHCVVQGLQRLIDGRRPSVDAEDAAWSRFSADSSVKIALFSLGNLAVHRVCREALLASPRTVDICRTLLSSCQREDMIYKYAQRLLQKLGG